MPRPYTISGIDIGNSQVKVVIARVNSDSLKPEIIGSGSAVSNGLRRGVIVDMEETIENVRSAVQRAEAMAGTKIKRSYLAVNGLHVHSQTSRGVIAVSRADNEISQNDIDRVIKAASVVSLPPNREIIHVIPKNFIVDGAEYVKNPLGMKGVRLEADVLIIDGLSPYLRNLIKCVNQNNIEVAGLVYAPIASSLSVLDKNQKEYGVVNIDFGGGTSSLSVYEEANLLHSIILPIGSRHITNDLAVLLRTSIDVAERIKIEHGSTSNAEDLRKRGELDLSEVIGEKNFVIPKKQIIKVIDARTQELFDIVSNELKKVSKTGLLPAGVVLSGGGVNLPGIIMLAKEKLRLPVRMARSIHFEGMSETVDDPAFSVAMGAVLWGMSGELGEYGGKAAASPDNNDVWGKFMNWLKNFMP
ncbi:MAG: cell division protein FtsA [Candidatus Yanofskybacteria bacterium RIFCSPHIGHO2_02_FULL_41_29]|uniref:Cell division protein FtsA n=1 Tax=Candidatus Yanofskybacteria bacterium RIFCSPHIGHO2_01_FULL_41_53 TaxID=1802663 RepID=A0A1F8EM51_9BACT|nr:MAG: cell division protein FtsA [Candidatus Yanofskybacteria bacterium RIFCSPHIGHO2_01_FULL_41_53]OGN12025.1 MAG: cell division protein FtsA [Candidatus Yanofskybacteria bacterium RIFCSPHIGHO2_02_FULL_41_29]OGN21271.1 MAG: cell division protein FtsA [Candidatus Yanofskybacteria bacterium RIFCSPLOWO2_01_FULL_41_67]OGN28653.1 MAG: cell division protein FtsA [Candidatus Yanofskybacteria bacterium RIFCSPLOWO2_02_FULL_41_13]